RGLETRGGELRGLEAVRALDAVVGFGVAGGLAGDVDGHVRLGMGEIVRIELDVRLPRSERRVVGLAGPADREAELALARVHVPMRGRGRGGGEKGQERERVSHADL